MEGWNYFVIIFACLNFAIMSNYLLRYWKFRHNQVSGLNHCLAFIAADILLVATGVVMLLIPEGQLLMFLCTFSICLRVLFSTLLIQAILSLMGNCSQNSMKIRKLLYIVPTFVMILSITNPLHQLVVQSIKKLPDGFGFVTQYGSINFFIRLYFLAVWGGVLAFAFYNNRFIVKKSKILIWVVLASSMITSVMDEITIAMNLSNVSFYSFTLWVPAVLISYVFFGYLNSSRSMAILNTNELYVVFDRWGNSVDSNRSAEKFFIKHFGTKRPKQQELLQVMGVEDLPTKTSIEFEIRKGNTEKYYRGSTFDISNSVSRSNGAGFLIQEVTEFHEKMNRLDILASEDPLTGVKNRRYFYRYAKKALLHSFEQSTPVTLLMLDLDHFKSINDTYGHSVGDEVLKSLCLVCNQCLRKQDDLCRYGGEEFIILVENMNAKAGKALARRICKALDSEPLITSEGPVDVTVSIGGCSLYANGESDSIERWLKLADQYLYKAKKNGRNRVEFYRENKIKGESIESKEV